jgi:hypothetical protein
MNTGDWVVLMIMFAGVCFALGYCNGRLHEIDNREEVFDNEKSEEGEA